MESKCSKDQARLIADDYLCVEIGDRTAAGKGRYENDTYIFPILTYEPGDESKLIDGIGEIKIDPYGDVIEAPSQKEVASAVREKLKEHMGKEKYYESTAHQYMTLYYNKIKPFPENDPLYSLFDSLIRNRCIKATEGNEDLFKKLEEMEFIKKREAVYEQAGFTKGFISLFEKLKEKAKQDRFGDKKFGLIDCMAAVYMETKRQKEEDEKWERILEEDSKKKEPKKFSFLEPFPPEVLEKCSSLERYLVN